MKFSDPAAQELLLRSLPPNLGHIAELEPDKPWTEQLRARTPAHYTGVPLQDHGRLPLPDQSQDLFLTCYVLERLPMDHLYMVCSEARRIVKTEGHWALLALGPQSHFLAPFVALFWGKWKGIRPLELSHYISPEDWRIIQEYRQPRWGLCSQLLLLQREKEPSTP